MNDFWTAISGIAAILTLCATSFTVGSRMAYKRAREELNSERELSRFSEIYAPLFGLFITCHISTSSGCAAPYFRQRLQIAVEVFCETHSFAKTAKALFDKKNLGISGEVEYGGNFPLSKITALVQGKEHLADARLLNLVARANRAQYEEMTSSGLLSDEDLTLFFHICDQHERLSCKFVNA